MFLSAVFPRFFLVLEHKVRMGGLGGNVASACEDLGDSEGGIYH